MKIYQIWCGFDERHQGFLIDQPEQMLMEDYRRISTFKGTPKDPWVPPKVYSRYPKKLEPDFWSYEVASGAFAVRPETLDLVYPFLTLAGQLLPLPYKGREFSICNILEYIDALDEEKSEGWRITPEGRKYSPRYPFFIPSHLSQSTLFKISELPIHIYCWEETCEPEDEFKACVEANKLTGLTFELVWSEEDGIVIPDRRPKP